MEDLKKEFNLFRAGGGRGRLLSRCRETLRTIPVTSVQPERDFSVAKQTLGLDRASLTSETLNEIFMLRKAFGYEIPNKS